MGSPWPALAARIVLIGGVSVTFAQAVQAAEILMGSRTSAIAPVLKSAGNPLAVCDYFGVAAPYIEQARQAPKTGRAGAAGRHVTKTAFLEAVGWQLAIAREQEVADGLEAMGTDERYAVAIAREAVTLRERAYASGVRSSVRSAVTRAVTACGAVSGQFTCGARTACGTGACRFAVPAYRGVVAVAAPGKFVRPVNHVHAGEGFTEAGAAAELTAESGYRAGVQVWDTDALGGWAA
jgi:hypothetical protein